MSRLIFPNNHFFGGNGNLYAIKLIAGLIDKIVFRIFKSGIADISPRFVLILDNILDSIPHIYSIENYINTGKVLLIDKNKRIRYKGEQVKVNKEFSFISLAKSSLDRTKFKLIRKIGHYGRYKDQSKNDLVACNQFFYDGKDCKDDICDVLFEKIAQLKDEILFDPTKIVFDCPESPWLAESISLLDTKLKSFQTDYSFSYTGCHNMSEIKELSFVEENILFIVPLIHTGTVFTKCYNVLRAKYPNAIIRSIAILVSDNENKFVKITDQNIEMEVNDDEKVSIDFFLKVNQQHYPYYDYKCPMCNELHMEIIKDSSYTNVNILTSFEVWTMCEEAGYGEEDFITDRDNNFPKQFPLLPKRLELIKNNSAYLALKYKKNIERNNLFESPDLILIFPDERTSSTELELRKTSIALEETASGYFAETLKQLQDIEYFGIPRNILDKIQLKNGKPQDLSFIHKEHYDFYSKLRLLSDDIIIMDEFCLSGTTLIKIIAILDIVRKKPKAYFPIFNFNPGYLNNQYRKDLPILSLYDFNIKSGLKCYTQNSFK